MKKLVLTGKQIALLIKVSESGFSFYADVDGFLRENSELPEKESVEFELDNDKFNDVIQMVTDYLKADDLEEEEIPTELERTELQELVDMLTVDKEEKGDDEEEINDEEEVDDYPGPDSEV
jgi:hypothetical protein